MSGVGSGPEEKDAQVERMQGGLRDWVLRVRRGGGRTLREFSPPALLSLLCASAFGPLVEAGAGVTGATVVASIGVLSSVGGNVLASVLISAIDRLRGRGEGRLAGRAEVEEILAQEIDTTLARTDANASDLRAEIGVLLGQIDASGTLVRAAVESGNEQVRADVIAAIGVLGSEFAELGFLIEDVAAAAAKIQQDLDEQGAQTRVIIEQNAQQSAEIRRVREDLAVLERRTRAGVPANGNEPKWEGCPYRGLLPFSEADAGVFYGRERLTTDLALLLASRMQHGGLVVVTGASGAGKSSLLRAGLLPVLARGLQVPGSDRWPRIVMTPSADPLTELAVQLAALGGSDVATVRDGLARDPGHSHLEARRAALRDAARHGPPVAAGETAARLVVLVDQFEEAFTLSTEPGGEADRQSFITALAAMTSSPAGSATEPAAMVVIAVRGDFCDQCAAYSELANGMQNRQIVVGPMTESDLRLAITGPAAAAGLRLEPGLTDTILDDLRAAGTSPLAGVLPLLSQAMMLTWENRDGNQLTGHGYGKTGGVSRAVQISADATYDALPDADQALAREILRIMTVADRDSRLTRRPVSQAALAGLRGPGQSPAGTVVEKFAERRLIVLGDGTAEIAHDALLTAWPRLRSWLEDDQASWRLHSQLADDAEEWDTSLRNPDFLYRGTQLEAVKQATVTWAANPDRYPALTTAQQDFLHASERASARGTRRRHVLILTLVILLIASLTGALLAVSAARNANHQRNLTARQSRLAASGELAAESQQLDDTDPVRAAQLAAAAWQIAPTAQARQSMLAVLTQPEHLTLPAVTHPARNCGICDTGVEAVAFSPDGKILATGGSDGKARLWNVSEDRQVGSPITAVSHTGDGIDAGIDAVAFSPDGKTLVTAGGADGSVRLWNVATHREIGSLITAFIHPGFNTVQAVAFSPDGMTLATAESDGTARLWNVATHREIGSPITAVSHPNGAGAVNGKSGVEAVAFSPDGRVLLTGGSDGHARLWNAATHREIGPPITAIKDPGSNGGLRAVAFSPKGTIVATGGGDGIARLWNVATHRQIGPPIPAGTEPNATDNTINAMEFSPGGDILATGGGDGIARLWNVATHRQIGPPITAIGNPLANGGVNAVAFRPGTTALATGGGDGTARLWDADIYRQIGPPIPSAGFYTSVVAFSPAGSILATGGSDGTTRLWNVATRRQIGPPIPAVEAHSDVDTMAFSPDGKVLATGGSDGTARLWNVATHREIGSPINAVIHTDRNAQRMALGPDGKILSIGSTGTGFKNVQTVVFSPDSKVLATGGSDGTVRLWDVATHRQIGSPITAVKNSAINAVEAVAFSPGGDILATGGGDGTMRLWDVATHREIGRPITAVNNSDIGGVDTVAFSPAGDILATGGGDDGTVRLWDVATHRPIGSPIVALTAIGANGGIAAVAFNPAGGILATGGGDGMARLWDVATHQEIGPPITAVSNPSSNGVEAVVFSPSGGILATVGDDGTARLWGIPSIGNLPHEVCAIAGTPLTRNQWHAYTPEPFQEICK